MKVRGLHDGTNVAMLLEYDDPSEDPEDAAALEFMVGDNKAHFAHGQPMAQVQGGPVNIWYWKNKDGKGVDMGAKGFGTLKPHAHQDVKAKGVYQGGAWKVVFSRPLQSEHADEDTAIQARRVCQYRVCHLGREKDGYWPAEGKGIGKSDLVMVVFPRRCAAGLFTVHVCSTRGGLGVGL